MNRHEALEHLHKAFGTELDRSGFPMTNHSVRVEGKVYRLGDAFSVAAFLHDVKEDTDYPIDVYLTCAERNTIDCLTHLPDEDYLKSYIERVCKDTTAAYVKLADLSVNMTRGAYPGESSIHFTNRIAKYNEAKARIWKALGTEWWPS